MIDGRWHDGTQIVPPTTSNSGHHLAYHADKNKHRPCLHKKGSPAKLIDELAEMKLSLDLKPSPLLLCRRVCDTTGNTHAPVPRSYQCAAASLVVLRAFRSGLGQVRRRGMQ